MELLGSYSNTKDLARLQRLLRLPADRKPSKASKPKQRQTRLRPEQVDELVRLYEEGRQLVDLAEQFKIHRRTVAKHLQARGLDLRYPSLCPDDVTKAAELYASGLSLAAVGERFGVNASTIRNALLRAGFTTRPRSGS